MQVKPWKNESPAVCRVGGPAGRYEVHFSGQRNPGAESRKSQEVLLSQTQFQPASFGSLLGAQKYRQLGIYVGDVSLSSGGCSARMRQVKRIVDAVPTAADT
jgi:hypothetical protein